VSNRCPSHRPAPVPAHNRSVASELDLSEAMVRALWRINAGRDGGFASPVRVYEALGRRGLLRALGPDEPGSPLSAEGRAACARLFPGVEKSGAS
jgi:hypothetical protein